MEFLQPFPFWVRIRCLRAFFQLLIPLRRDITGSHTLKLDLFAWSSDFSAVFNKFWSYKSLNLGKTRFSKVF